MLPDLDATPLIHLHFPSHGNCCFNGGVMCVHRRLLGAKPTSKVAVLVRCCMFHCILVHIIWADRRVRVHVTNSTVICRLLLTYQHAVNNCVHQDRINKTSHKPSLQAATPSCMFPGPNLQVPSVLLTRQHATYFEKSGVKRVGYFSGEQPLALSKWST